MPVYIARFGLVGPVKIGCTRDVAMRLEYLGAKLWDDIYLLRMFDGGRPEEAKLHRRFVQQRIRYEWFHYHADMMGDLGLPEITREAGVTLNSLLPSLRNGNPADAALSDSLRAWMIKRNFDEVELAALIGCARGTVSNWLRFGNQPQIKVRQKLRELSDGELFPPDPPASASAA